jgi:hypothetical protein
MARPYGPAPIISRSVACSIRWAFHSDTCIPLVRIRLCGSDGNGQRTVTHSKDCSSLRRITASPCDGGCFWHPFFAEPIRGAGP